LFEQDSKKSDSISGSDSACQCKSTHGLYVHNRQLSWVVASVILMNFCLFVGGYFWGQKNAIDTFANKIDQETFSDQIYSSLCSLCETAEVEEEGDEEQAPDAQAIAQNNEQAQADTQEMTPLAINQANNSGHASQELAQSANPDIQGESIQKENEDTTAELAQSEYYAQLVGFGSERNAQKFAQKLTRKEIPVVVKKRQSRTARGRFVSWYQVVTEKFNDRAELEELINRLAYEENITGIQIITC
jgi:septal ring-binding cell division protein DamX